MEVIFLSVVLLILFGFNIYTNYYHYKFILLSLIANMLIALKISIIYGIPYGLFYYFVIASMTWVALPPVSIHFAHPPRGNNSTLSHSVLKSYASVISLGIISIAFNSIKSIDLIYSLKILHVINVFLTFIPARFTKFKIQAQDYKAPICGFGANVSVNATLLSLMTPILFFDFDTHLKYNLIALALTFLAILKTKASAGLVSFLISTWCYFAMYYKFSGQYIASTVVASVIFSIIIYFIINKLKKNFTLCSISGRQDIFRFAQKWIMPNWNKYVGIGFGTLSFIYPSTLARLEKEKLNQFRIGSYIWIHNDIYQLWMEGGIIGLAIGTVCYVYAFYLAITTYNLAGIAFLISYFFNSLFNFPNHMVPDLIVIISFIKFITEGII